MLSAGAIAGWTILGMCLAGGAIGAGRVWAHNRHVASVASASFDALKAISIRPLRPFVAGDVMPLAGPKGAELALDPVAFPSLWHDTGAVIMVIRRVG
jgi:hypothetical protein